MCPGDDKKPFGFRQVEQRTNITGRRLGETYSGSCNHHRKDSTVFIVVFVC
jgi:hypothetical protein